MGQAVHILHLEDDADDSHTVADVLRKAGIKLELQRVENLAAFEAALSRAELGLILSDYTLPGVDALQALRLARERRPEVPFVFFSGTIQEDLAVESLKAGATDYVFKENCTRLAPAVRRALREAEDLRQRQVAEESLKRARDELAQINADLERRVLERTEQLKEANANLQTFAYTAAHDLRAPLRSIRSFSKIVIEDFGPQMGPEGQALLERVAAAADQMSRLLDALLEYSKVSAAEIKLDPISLRAAVGDALALLETEIQSKKAVVEIGEPLPATILGHRASLVLLIENFLSNALKFVPPGVSPRVKITAEVAGGWVRLSVRDNGIGIEPKDLKRLFAAFQRLRGQQDYPGSGLGLAIAHKAAQRMGGRVGVTSEPGAGSCFWVELQLVQDQPTGQTEPTQA